ncbi:hypothetical protein Vadar_022746 [Vaccinium darrowii]|uniref:Uncharacterized protein n=1 Tax=Vaccinium darrowii TaxID=229202 RepID=A0ACB7YHK3_9ERIC|nr:hypothetical protein Vadar_022746 [Vaccinium darrowii]
MVGNFRRDPERETTNLFPSIVCFFFASNSIGTLYRAYSRGDYTTLAFVVFEYSAFLLLDLCFTALHKLPSRDRTKWRKFLQMAIWVLYSGISFAFSAYFGPFFDGPGVGYTLYGISAVGSALLFYMNVVWDYKSGCDACLEEERVRERKLQQYYVYVLDKV